MKIKLIETAKNTDARLSQKEFEGTESGKVKISIDKDITYQTFIGFGGAFTEAASTTLDKMSREKRKEAIEAYFDSDKGIGYSFCRTHINSCDFSLGNYAYTETAGDTELKDFSIERDRKSLIPLIKEAIKLSPQIKLFASPWSPPAWMKTNERMNNGGKLKEEYKETWARYFARYIKEYKKEGIDIWGITIQNEPMAETSWDNCIYSSEEERDFVKILGPTLKEENLENVKIIVWDHNKDIMKERVDVMLSDEEASKWVWGVGFHWYGDGDDKSILDNSILDYTHDKFKKELIFTEGCNPHWNTGKTSLVGEWWTGEKYGKHIIADLNHWTSAWTDWNIVLDEKGGPNHVGNHCDAPIIADTTKDILHYNSPYYYIGHFSKYIKTGYQRINSKINSEDIYVTAWSGENKVILVIMNEKDSSNSYEIEIGKEKVVGEIKEHSIQTLIIE